LLDLSGVCKIAANMSILPVTLFLAFQKIYAGCCTVAAQVGDDQLGAPSLVCSEDVQHGP
jgi:hypothetical protein